MTHLTKAVFTVTFLAQLVHSQERSRVIDRVDNSLVTRFTHTSHPATQIARDLGRAQADLKMDRILMALQISPERQAELEQLIADQHDPASQRYRRWLTPEEFGRQFGPAQADIDAVTHWLESHGLRVNSLSRGRRFLEFSGTARQVESAFQTEIHHYDLNGEAHIANATDIAVPEALAPVIAGLVSLHDFHSRPMHHGLRAVPLDGITVFSGTIAPDDFATIYNVKPLWNQGFDGTGQSVAVATRSNIRLSDVTAFRSQFGLPANKLQVIVNGPDPGILPSLAEEAEAILDTEWAGAVAKGATVKLVVSKSTNALDGIALSSVYIIDNNLAPVMNMSYGNCEANLGTGNAYYAILWQQAAAEGISVMVASGDSGSAGCDDPNSRTPASRGLAVSGFASTPNNIAVGGTSLGGSSNAPASPGYIPESAWNESSYATGSSFNSLLGGGGGVSHIYATPAWQTGKGVPSADPGSPSQHHRYVPDVSLMAAGNDPYLIRLEGGLYSVSGTSVASPAFAGLAAILAQHTGGRNGNLNTQLYTMATLVPAAFHDITEGTNAVPCLAGTPQCSAAVASHVAGIVTTGVMDGYAAGPGYDLATGLGSVDAFAMVFNWGAGQFHPRLPAPVINMVSPNPMTASPSAQTLTIDGANFATGVTVLASYAGGAASSLAITSFASNRIKALISTGTAVGAWTLVVRNPDGQSVSTSLQVTAPPPVITSLSPNPMTASATPQTLTIKGANFAAGVTVLASYPGGALNTLAITSLNANQITATISTGTAPHTWNIVVKMPGVQLAAATLQVK